MITEQIEKRCAKAVASGTDWLVEQYDSDGAVSGFADDVAAYYKTLLTFAVCGRIADGQRILRHVRSRLVTAEGDLGVGDTKTTLARMQRNLANYMDGWIVIGAWLHGDYALAECISAQLQRFQSEMHGGVQTGPLKWAVRARYDLATAASCGRAFLLTGHRSAAIAAADFLVEALKHQSQRGVLLLSYDDQWTPVPPEDDSERTYFTFDPERSGEKVWFPAFSCAFLAEIFQLVQDTRYLEAATEYYAMITRTPEYRGGTLANGKTGWAAGLLVQLTGETGYFDALSWIGPNVLGRQQPDGEFGAAPRSGSSAESPFPRRLERTAEFTLWSAVFLRYAALGLLKDGEA
jgi:hypothetical protein